ncbi:MAG: hypothetical protein Q4C56_06865 [Peptococcaceae bacterium]|nr:hypothetical protein [Peptococcaceae bacterium]
MRHAQPCKDCAERVSGCHASCEKYCEWKTHHDAARDARRADTDYNAFKAAHNRRYYQWERKRHGKRK